MYMPFYLFPLCACECVETVLLNFICAFAPLVSNFSHKTEYPADFFKRWCTFLMPFFQQGNGSHSHSHRHTHVASLISTNAVENLLNGFIKRTALVVMWMLNAQLDIIITTYQNIDEKEEVDDAQFSISIHQNMRQNMGHCGCVHEIDVLKSHSQTTLNKNTSRTIKIDERPFSK